MELLNRFEKFLRDNYPGKSSAIKVTTARILRDFTIALYNFIQENPNMPPEQILQDPDFLNRLILIDWKGRKFGGVGSIIPEMPDELKENPHNLMFRIIWSMVVFELSYDPTIGTEKDIKTVWNMMESYVIEQCNYWYEQELREQKEKLKDPDGFTLKERQEWEQLLKEERKERYEEALQRLQSI